MDNIELVPLELMNSNMDAIRKAREAFQISKGKHLEHSGLNKRKEIQSIYFNQSCHIFPLVSFKILWPFYPYLLSFSVATE